MARPTLGEPRSREAVARAHARFRADFAGTMRIRVQNMFGSSADPALVERVAAHMSSAPPHMAISAAEEWVSYDHQLQTGLREISARKISIRASPSPTDAEGRAYGIETMRTSVVGHFPMLEDPDGFNRLLEQAVQKCSK